MLILNYFFCNLWFRRLSQRKVQESIRKKYLFSHSYKFIIAISQPKVSDRNSFWANQNYSDSFRYLYPSQCESMFYVCSMWAQSAKQKTKSQLHNTFKKKEILSFSVIGSSFSALHFALTWNDTSTRGLISSINMAALSALIFFVCRWKIPHNPRDHAFFLYQ